MASALCCLEGNLLSLTGQPEALEAARMRRPAALGTMSHKSFPDLAATTKTEHSPGKILSPPIPLLVLTGLSVTQEPRCAVSWAGTHG